MLWITRSWISTAQIGGLLLLLVSIARADDGARVQLGALLRDRPRIATTLESRPEVSDWILRRWEETDPPLVWDPLPPVSGRAAEWDARDSTVTMLRVDGGPSGIDQLTHLLFELHNVGGYAIFAAIHEAAVQDEITRDEYASRMLEQEFRALLAARAFYREHLADLSEREKKEARSHYRLLYGTASFEEHVWRAQQRGVDLREHYRELYDTVVLTERAERTRGGEDR